jgi:hypothetical protein
MNLRFLAALGSVIVLLAGCGEKADCPPGSSDARAGPSPSASTKKPTYSFGLPTGDGSTETRWDNWIYVTLDEGHCTEAQKKLDELSPAFADFEMPQEIILYQAAIHLCLNHTQDAKNTYALVTSDSKNYPSGWRGIGWHGNVLSWHICELYKSVTGVFEQRSGDSISCKYRGFEPEQALSDYEWFWHAPTAVAAPPNFARDDPRRHKAS